MVGLSSTGDFCPTHFPEESVQDFLGETLDPVSIKPKQFTFSQQVTRRMVDW